MVKISQTHGVLSSGWDVRVFRLDVLRPRVFGVRSYCNSTRTLDIRPLFFISLFLVTSARSFQWELKKKKKIDHWSGVAKFDLSRTWSCMPTTTSSASEAYRSFASSVAVPVPSLLRKRFHRSSSLHILCAKNALRRGCVFALVLEGRSRCAPDCHTGWLTWPGHWDVYDPSYAWKTKVCTFACLWPDAVWGYWDFFWGEIFFSVRSVAFLRKMWRETEIKITVA